METLGNYSNLRGGENTALALIGDARRCQTPTGNRNEPSLQKQVRLTETQIAELLEAYKKGDSVYALARRFGVHRTTVSEHLHRAGVPTRAVRLVVLDDQTRDRVLDAARSGMAVKRIATLVGATERVVARTLDEAGVPRRRSDSALA